MTRVGQVTPETLDGPREENARGKRNPAAATKINTDNAKLQSIHPDALHLGFR